MEKGERERVSVGIICSLPPPLPSSASEGQHGGNEAPPHPPPRGR